jgi:hypothetical protein
MDKQEAIDFVLDELDKGRSLPEITAALSRQLGAPVDLVGKFVTQTAERYQQSKAALGKPATASQQPTAYRAQPASGSSQPLAYSPQPPAYSPQTAANRPAATAAGATAVEPIPEPDAAHVPSPVAEPLPPAEPELAATPELEKFILNELTKNQRDSDVVLRVVEKTGMNYRQAQRLVSRVGAKDYKKVTARQNCLIIPLALVFLVAGLVLLCASVVEAYQIRLLLPSPNLSIEQIQAAVERGRILPWAFGVGLALSVGGGIGVFSAVRKQTE